ncbi:MAG: MTAP family purine nucleoside phosphorylase [Nitrospirota bacterium]
MREKFKNNFPQAKIAFIGGSGTFSIRFPEDLHMPGVKVLGQQVFPTPFGNSPEFTLFSVQGEPALTVKMHGWRAGITRADASRQIFWVFEKAGVKTILAEGGVGSVSREFALCDLFIPDDYIDLSMRKDVHLSDNYLLIMRDPVCPFLSGILARTAQKLFPDRTIHGGVYAVTDGRHFESRAEVRMISSFGADAIGQTLCPEVYLAREIGACYAGIYLIVNRAEGIGPDWSHAELKDIFYQEALKVGKIILESLKKVKRGKQKTCQCATLRKKTLLKQYHGA